MLLAIGVIVLHALVNDRSPSSAIAVCRVLSLHGNSFQLTHLPICEPVVVQVAGFRVSSPFLSAAYRLLHGRRDWRRSFVSEGKENAREVLTMTGASYVRAISGNFTQFGAHIWGYLNLNVPSLIEALDWMNEQEHLR